MNILNIIYCVSIVIFNVICAKMLYAVYTRILAECKTQIKKVKSWGRLIRANNLKHNFSSIVKSPDDLKVDHIMIRYFVWINRLENIDRFGFGNLRN